MDGRDEAARWINLALKLLVNRDLVGTKTFAIRAQEADPTMGYAEEILAVVDTLMAGQQQINGRYDWYGILQLGRLTRDAEMIAGQYRRLAMLLNPQRNGLPFAEEAFGLVNEAWSVLSNPLRKSLYDNELSWLDSSGSGIRVQVQQHQFLPMQSQTQQQQQFHPQPQNVPPVRVQPQVVTPFRAQPQVVSPPRAQQPQAPVKYLPQFHPPPQPQVQFQLTPKPQVHSPPPPQPQVHSQPPPQPQVHSPPPPPPPPQPQVHSQPPPKPHVQSQPPPQPQVKSQPPAPAHNQTHTQPPVQQQPNGQQNPHFLRRHQETTPVQVDPPMWKTPFRGREEEDDVETEEVITDSMEADGAEISTFWTACPYCYHLFEYLKEYQDCTLRCQYKNCRRAFHGTAIAPPPELKSNKGASFCSWGFFPIGASPVYLDSGKNGSEKHSWLPFSPMFACPIEPGKGATPVAPNGVAPVAPNGVTLVAPNGRKRAQAKPKAVIVDDDEYVMMELSDSSDDSDTDWGSNGTRSKKRGRPPKGKSSASKSAKRSVVEKPKSRTSNNANGKTHDGFADGVGGDALAEKVANSISGLNGNVSLSMKATSGKNPEELGKLDLNVEFNNEVEETIPTKNTTNVAETSTGAGTSTGAVTSNGEEENIEAEGIGFFEGLDEFLNSLPILSAVGDDKAKAV